MEVIKICLLLTSVLHSNGLDVFEQMAHIARRKAENRIGSIGISRRVNFPDEPVILGAPMYPYHLPKSDPILPGHTLIRPSVSMLKSAVKFPHREQENGAGVYGHIDNLGIKYDGKNDRVMYSGFRRFLPRRFKPLQNYKMNKLNRLQQLFETSRESTEEVRSPEDETKYYYFTRYEDKQERQRKRDASLAKALETEGIVLKDFLNMIKSLRREQEYRTEIAKRPKKYVPGNSGLGSFVITHHDSDEEEINKTTMFWNTKDLFNHIKVNPEAPELTELLPVDANDNMKNWWFYHQADFEEFEDR